MEKNNKTETTKYYGKKTYVLSSIIARKKNSKERIPDYNDNPVNEIVNN